MGTAQFLFKAMKTHLFAKAFNLGNSFQFRPSLAVGKTESIHLAIKVAFTLLILCATGSVYAQSCSGISLGANASLNGFVPFPSSNVWNTNIASAPVDPNSAVITSEPGFAGLHLHPDFGSESIYGIPYVVVDSTITPSVPINVIDYPDESDVVAAPYPATAPIEGYPDDCTGWPDGYNGDAHVLVLDRAKCVLYETWNTNRCNGHWNASSETVWDMNNYETRPWGWTSADAAGLPIFPGLVRYDEIASGAIHHAIRFTMQQTKNDNNGGYFVYPASHAAGVIWGSYNVMGMRIRLKASFDISSYSAVNQIILTAMKQYGMILADNGGYFFFQGVSDPRFDDDDLNNLRNVASSNFEVVQMNPGFPGYDSETAPAGAPPTINSFTPSASSVSSGSPVTLSYSVSDDSYDYIDVIGPVAAGSGSVTVNPTATQTYTLNSTNAYGRTTSTPITVTVPGSVVTPPVVTPPAGAYASTQTVTLSSATSPSATIYYTTNGSTPTASSPVFSITNPIVVSSSETVKAVATATGYTAPSAVASATYAIGPLTAAAPVFSPAAGTYVSAQTVTISDATPGATIYYTVNGTTPTTSSSTYTGAIAVPAKVIIQAVAVAAGYTSSTPASAAYAISNPVVATPVFSEQSETYTGAQTVTISDATSGAAIYYTTNGSVPTTSSTKYTGAINVAASETIQAIAVATGYANSAVASATYTIVKIVVATPVFSVQAGTYTSVQSVGLSDATSGATIYYTTDGSAPTTGSTTYTGAIRVDVSETIQAIAVATGDTNSATASAIYTINMTVAPSPVFSVQAGTYSSPQTVTLSGANPQTIIFYTIDGTTPTINSTRYSSAIAVAASETIKAIAAARGCANSGVASAAYSILQPAATPMFSAQTGTYTSAQSVTFSDATSGAAIYYTTNGSVPTTSSPKYTGAIIVAASETIHAIAVATGYTNSAVASATYTIIKVVVATPVFSVQAGTYTSVQSVAISDATSGATIYYTTDGSAPTTGSTAYTGAIRVDASQKIQAIAVATGDTNSATASAIYTISMPVAPSPAFSVQAGTYSSPQTVTLSGANPQTIIFYTIDGTTPTINSTRYSSAIPIAASETIKAIAAARGCANSAVASAAYSILQPAATPMF